MKQGEEPPAAHDLSSLRLLGSVGEPINPEAWRWYRDTIGGGRTPGRRHLVADRDRPDHDLAAPGRHDDQAGLRDLPAAGHRGRRGRRRRQRPSRWAAAATSCSSGRGRGCCAASTATRSGTSETYWSRFPGMYFAGDGAKRDDGRLPVAARPRRRRHERRRAPDLDDGGRVGARRPPVGRGGGGRRQERPDHRPGDLRVRDPQDGPGAERRARRSSSGSTSRTSSGRSRGPKFLMFGPTCRRRGPARSCAGSCATSRRAGRWAT